MGFQRMPLALPFCPGLHRQQKVPAQKASHLLPLLFGSTSVQIAWYLLFIELGTLRQSAQGHHYVCGSDVNADTL